MRELSIIILQHNTPDHIERNLTALKAAELPENTEIIVVDNGGKGANAKVPKEAYTGLDVKFFEMPNLGFPKGNNFGLSKTEAKNYAFINPDIIVRPDTIKVLLDYLKANPEVGIAVPQLIYPDGVIQDSFRTFPRLPNLVIKRIPWLRKLFPGQMRNYLMWDKDPEVTEPVDWAVGAFTVVTKECMDALEQHDETYFLFMSDVGISREAWDKGYATHYVPTAKATHNDKRLSAGSPMDVFRKKIIRLHIKDAIRYFRKYLFKPLPKDAPSVNKGKKREHIMRAHKLSRRPHVVATRDRLQKTNPVVHVYKGKVDGPLKYEQPIVFFDTSTISVVMNQAGEIGLMKIWRHTPLQFTRKNTFPVFPDVGNLGIWSWETVRGGLETEDQKAKDAALRELQEELGLKADQIESMTELGKVIGNTAIDVFHHKCFKVVVNDSFKFQPESKVEAITEFKFFKREELKKMLANNEISCGLTQASILQAVLNA